MILGYDTTCWATTHKQTITNLREHTQEKEHNEIHGLTRLPTSMKRVTLITLANPKNREKDEYILGLKLEDWI